MRILAVLYCYPPLLVPAAVCYAKLMAGLRANGAEVEIVTIAPDSFAGLGSPVLRDHALAQKVRGLATEHVIQSPETSLLVRAAKRLDSSRRFTYRWLEPRKREWTYPALRYLRRLDLSRFDLLLTCSQPHTNHLLGLMLQARTGLPWVAYFSDPWTDNPYFGVPSERVRTYNRAWEDRVLAAADLVLFTCQEMKDLVARNHAALDPQRSGVLPHSFVSEWYAHDADHKAPHQPGPFRILHTGSFYVARTPLPLIEALQRVSAQVPLEGRLRIDSFGDMDEEHRQLIARLGLERIFNVQGSVPYLDTLAMMTQYDALLLVDAPLTSGVENVFLPSKLVDYLGARRPVVAVTPNQGATARVVREVGGIVCPLETPTALDDFLLGVIREQRVQGCPREEGLAQYGCREVGRSLLAQLKHCVPERR